MTARAQIATLERWLVNQRRRLMRERYFLLEPEVRRYHDGKIYVVAETLKRLRRLGRDATGKAR